MRMERGEARWRDGQEICWMRSTCGSGAKSSGCLSLWSLPLFILKGVALMILFEKVWGVNILDWFPGIVTFRVPFPFHKVLERSRLPMTSVVDQVFDFVFFGTLDQVRWRF